MSRDMCDRQAPARLPQNLVIQPSRLCWQAAHAALLGVFAAGALASEPPHHRAHLDQLLLPPRVITSVQQDSPLTIITNPREARQPIPASDGADYLKTIPGFSAVRGGGSNSDPVLRGMFGSRLKLLTNGGEMLGACPSRMDAPSSYIAPQNFDQLTVIKGPQTVAWGPGNSAGTILFDRLPEGFDEPDSRLNASVVAGSNTRRDVQLDGAVGSSDGYLRLSGNRSRSGDYKDGNGDRVPSRWNKWNADLALGWTPNDDTLLELSVGAGDGEARYAGRGMDGSQFERESLGLRFEKQFYGGSLRELEARVYYNYADHVMDGYSLRAPSGMGAVNVDRRTLGARLGATWVWDNLELLAGADAQRNTHRTRSDHMGMMNTYQHQPWLKDASFSQIGLFSELSWARSEEQRLIGGVRLDQHHVEDFRITISGGHGHGGGHPMPPPANPTAGDTRRETLPAAFLRLEQDLSSLPATAYVGIGHVQRFPDYWELFSPRQSPGAVNAFDGVDPERTTQLDIGLQYQRDGMEAWVSGYAGMVDDFILFDYTGMGGVSSAENIDAHIMGAEAGIALDVTDNWQTETSLAWAWGRNRSDGEALPQMPPLEARFNLTYARDNWSAGALWRVVAAQNRTADGKGNVTSKDFGDSAGFGVLSLNAAYRFSPEVTASVGVDNLLDKAYAEHLNLAGNGSFGFPADTRISEPGRTLWAKLDFSF